MPEMQNDLVQFLKTVVTTPSGLFCLCSGTGHGEWYEEFYQWPDDIDKIIARAQEQSKDFNVYFSPHLFSKKSSTKANVLPTKTIQADLDEADLSSLTIPPTVLIETSPGRHQAYWVCEEEVSNDILEVYSQNMTYSIPNCDRTGWPLGHKFRFPGTINYKREPQVNQIIIKQLGDRRTKTIELEILPGLETYKLSAQHFDIDWLSNVDNIAVEKPLAILESIKHKLAPPSVYTQYSITSKDRSVALWTLMCSLFRAGLSRTEVFIVAHASANNKFADLKYHGRRELGKDVLRAEEATATNSTNIKTMINQTRKLPGSPTERRQQMARLIMQKMQQEGTFIHCDDDSCWYIRHDAGRPVHLGHRSEYLEMLISIEFGLNQVETEQRYVVNELCNYCRSLPESGTKSVMSHVESNLSGLLMHTGRKEVLKVSSQEIVSIRNGSNGYVFPWQTSIEPFRPNFDTYIDWGEELFGSSLESIIDVDRDEAMSVLKVWLMFILFKDISPSKPILALFGQPGAGKSTIFKKVYALFYGKKRSIGSVSNRDDFDYALSNDCLIVLDNLDTWEPWLPDRLALAAGSTDRIKRKLYTDTDTVTMKCQAIVGITAHNPQFGREDVADRLLILNFRRRFKFEAEYLVVNKITERRNLLWGSILKDVQKILATEMPLEYPQFRIQDFARMGAWLSKGMGCGDKFNAAVTSLAEAQKAFVLDEDQMLVDALYRYLDRRNGDEPAWESATTLWSRLESFSPDSSGFSKRYKNPVSLGKKLNAFQEPLSSIMKVEQLHSDKGAKLWRFEKFKNEGDKENGA